VKILVVDDNMDGCLMLKMLLTIQGHTVEAKYDGPSALQCLKEFQADLILLDIGLPGMSGWEVAQQLRQDKDQVTIYALTGYGDPADIQRSMSAGINRHFIKPYDPDELAQALKEDGLME
jgi:CheY-like chemotaxis protein